MAYSIPNPSRPVVNPASHLESHGHSRLWTDPDYLPFDSDTELPMLSTIGRGPRGEGVLISVEQTDDGYYLRFSSDLTGATICQSGNLSAGIISAHQLESDIVSGSPTTFYIDVTRGGTTTSYPIVVPTSSGSRVYFLNDALVDKTTTTKIYYLELSDFNSYGYNKEGEPRIGDVVMADVLSTDKTYTSLGIGVITAISSENKYVLNLYLILPTRTPYIKDGNWWVGDTDTGVAAQGLSSDEIRSEIKTEVTKTLNEQELLTKEEIEALIDEKISKVSYYINDNGFLVRETSD